MAGDQMRELLDSVTVQLRSQLEKIDLDEDAPDRAINSISVIVRTLDKIEQLGKILPNTSEPETKELTTQEYEQLRTKVTTLIEQAVKRETKRQAALSKTTEKTR